MFCTRTLCTKNFWLSSRTRRTPFKILLKVNFKNYVNFKIKLEEAEAYALKGGRKALAAVQARMKDIEGELDGEQRRHAETLKNYRKMDRRLKELTFQVFQIQI